MTIPLIRYIEKNILWILNNLFTFPCFWLPLYLLCYNFTNLKVYTYFPQKNIYIFIAMVFVDSPWACTRNCIRRRKENQCYLNLYIIWGLGDDAPCPTPLYELLPGVISSYLSVGPKATLYKTGCRITTNQCDLT